MTIKEIKDIIIQKFENDESNDTKSEDDFNNNITYQSAFNSSKSLTNIINKNNDFTKKLKNNNIKENKVNVMHKKANLFYKGKELINDEQTLGNFILESNIETLEFSVIILNVNESTFIDENKTKEKLIKNISESCPQHKGKKELYICLNCNVAFCINCLSKHKSHKFIEKINLIQFKDELKTIDREISQNLNKNNLSDVYEIKKSNENNCYNNDNLEKLQNRIDNLKQLHKRIINDYKREVDKVLPFFLEFKEKTENLIEISYKLDTIQNEQDFIDYYNLFINIKKNKEKINKEMKNLQKKKQNFNDIMEEFDKNIKNILINTEKDYKAIQKYYYNYNNRYDNTNQFRKCNSFSTLINPELCSSIQSKNFNTPLKLNLFSLLNYNSANIETPRHLLSKRSSIEANNLTDRFLKSNQDDLLNNNSNKCISLKKSFNDKYKGIFERDSMRSLKKQLSLNKVINKKNLFEEIEEKSEIEESLEEYTFPKIICNIKPKTKNIYCFHFETKTIDEIKLNLNNISIDFFELSHGSLNYKNQFYISGGSNSPNLFCKYIYKNNDNNLYNLKDMPSNHCFHGMVAIKSNIYVIGGYNSKKTEKYNVFENSWEPLADLNKTRIWPNCLNYKNRYIYVFGGLYNQGNNEEKILIEKIDINSIKNNWELIYLNNRQKIKLSNNLGAINFDDNYFLFIGGKSDSEDNIINKCYKFYTEEKIIEKDNNFEFYENEVFNGKLFTNFGNYYYGEFSSNNFNNFYLLNRYKKTFEIINYKNGQ